MLTFNQLVWTFCFLSRARTTTPQLWIISWRKLELEGGNGW